MSDKTTNTYLPVDDSENCVVQSEVILKEHIVLLDKNEAEPKCIQTDLLRSAGYTAEHSQLEGHEEAFLKIRLAQERADVFLQQKKEEIDLLLNEDTESDVFVNATERQSDSCGSFVTFINGKAVCQMHSPCSCSVCTRLDTECRGSSDTFQPFCYSSHKVNTAEVKPGSVSDKTLTVSAEALFQNFFHVHQKLPFDLKNISENSKMSDGFCDSDTTAAAEISETYQELEQSLQSIEHNDEPLLFTSLPYEIIQKILSYLSHYELSHLVAMVSQRWKQFAYDPIHWTSLHIVREMSSYEFACLLKRTPLLKELYLYGQCIDFDEMLFIVQSCPQLKVLDLGFVSTLFDGFISVIAKHCENLEYLNVEGCAEFDPKCLNILCEDGCVQKLKGLNVSHCTKLTDDSILKLVQHKEHLEMLNVDGISWLTDSTLTTIASLRGETLRCLYIDGAELTIHTLQAIATHCHQIEVLSWSFAELLLDTALFYVKQMGSLKELTLKKGMEWTEEGAKVLFDGESQLKNLKTLDLSEWTNMGDEGIGALTKCCGSQLIKLSLCWCWNITDVGLKYIIDNCKNLVDLDLLGIDKIKGPCLIDIPNKIPQLKRLHLRQCNKIDDDLIVTILRTMPNLKAYNYYGDEFEVHVKTPHKLDFPDPD